jgi:uncharacterized protein (TIGR03435 family)
MRQTVVLSLVVASVLRAAQTEAETPGFEVASVKVAARLATDRFAGVVGVAPDFAIRTALVAGMKGGPGSNNPGYVTYRGFTLRMFLMKAYMARADEIFGPKWLDTVGYDVTAKLPPGTDNKRLILMLQALLKERFRVSVHREMRQMRVYALTVAKGGSKLDLAAPAPPPPSNGEQIKSALNEALKAAALSKPAPELGSRHIRLRGATMARFASALSDFLDLPVKDMTGLDGYYSFSLNWTPSAGEPGGSLVSEAETQAQSGPPLFSAVEHQLGLTLRMAKGPVEVLIVDNAERTPTEN